MGGQIWKPRQLDPLSTSSNSERRPDKSKDRRAINNNETQKWQGNLINNRLNHQNGPHCFEWDHSWCWRSMSEIGANQSLLLRQIATSDQLHYLSALRRTTRICCPYSCGLSSISSELLHSSTQRRTNVFIFHTTIWSTMAWILPWHSAVVPKPEVKNDEVRILWDVPTHTAECRIQTRSQKGNGPDVTVFDKRAQEILVVEFSCPWVTNRVKRH